MKTLRLLLLAIPAFFALPLQPAQADCWEEVHCTPVCQEEMDCGWEYTDSGPIYSCDAYYDCVDECYTEEICDDDDGDDDNDGGSTSTSTSTSGGQGDPVGYKECTTTQQWFDDLGGFPPPVGQIIAICTNYCKVYCDGQYFGTIENDAHECESWECYNPYGSGGCTETFPIYGGGLCG